MLISLSIPNEFTSVHVQNLKILSKLPFQKKKFILGGETIPTG